MPLEAWLRIGSFACVLGLMAALETLRPRRPLTKPRGPRALRNLSMTLLSTLLVRFAFPILPVGLAVFMRESGFGLLAMAGLPAWLEFLLALLLFDVLIYWQHRVFHLYGPLWRVHRMHHADLDIDTTTALRFHPIEIAASMLLKLAAVALLGPLPLAVLVFEIGLNGCALFNHANLELPEKMDRAIRFVLVTPDMHRVHHSVDMREANTNFGFCLSWWDHLFRSYTDQPAQGHLNMRIGLNILRENRWQNFRGMLLIPFR